MSKDIFKRNPNLKEVFITSDENPFYSKNAAENHARNLGDKTIQHVINPSEKLVVVEGDNKPDSTPVKELKLTPKQQAAKEYEEKFGEKPYEDATKAMILEAIEKTEKLVEPQNS